MKTSMRNKKTKKEKSMFVERGVERRVGLRRVMQIPIDENQRKENERRSKDERRKDK